MLDGTNATFAYVDKDGFAVASPTFAYDGTAHTCAKTSLTYTGKGNMGSWNACIQQNIRRRKESLQPMVKPEKGYC